MNKKSIIIICFVIILFAVTIVGFNEFYLNSPDSYKMKIGDAVFDIPNEFHTVNVSSNFVKLSDGNHSVFIEELPNDVDYYVNEYKVNLSNINSTAISSSQVFNGVHVEKVISNQTGATHYWFEYNNKVYSIYTWAPFDEMESITANLIKSIQ